MFIDDGISAAERYKRAVFIARLFRETLENAGFIIATEKSMLPEDASQTVQYLGFIINSRKMTISAPQSKLDNVEYWLKKGLSSKRLLILIKF